MMNVIYCGFPDNYYEENNKKQLLNLEVRQYLSNKNHSAVFKKVASIDNIDMPYDFYIVYITSEEQIVQMYNLKKQFGYGEIIVVADVLDFSITAFAYQCLGYAVLPLKRPILYKLLDNMCEKIRRGVVTVYTPEGMKRIQTAELLYVNIEGRTICYHLTGNRVIRSGVLRKNFKDSVCRDLLTNNIFLFMEPSLIVNTNRITMVGVNDLIKFGEVELYVSKRQRDRIAEFLAR